MSIAFINAVDPAAAGCANAFVREKKLTKARIQCEAEHAMPRGVDHHCAGAVYEIARSNLIDAFLQAIFDAAVRRMVRDPAMDGEDRADAGIDVDVGRPIE